MTTFSRKNLMAAVFLGAATIGLPVMAHAGNTSTSNYRYDDCRKSDTEAQLLGAALGAVAGGVAGSQVAGNGARTEGSAIGALLGVAAGVAIADKDCGGNDGYRSTYRTGSRTNGYNTTRQTYGSSQYGTSYGNNGYYNTSSYPRRTTGYSSNGYRSNGHRARGRAVGNPHVNRGYTPFERNSHVCNRNETRLEHIKWEIQELRREREYLERERRYAGGDRRIDRRLWEIGNELKRLKDKKKYASDYSRDRNNYYYKTKH